MIAAILGLAWVLAVVVASHGRAPAPRHVDGDPTASRRPTARTSAVAALGAVLRRAADRPPRAEADRRVGWAAITVVALAATAPPLAPLPAVWVLAAPALGARRAARAHEEVVVDQLPDVIDLVALTTSAGLPVSATFGVIGSRPGGPLGEAVAGAAAHVANGGTTAGALALIGRVAGPLARPLVDALADHDRYGTPLGPPLERAALEARLRRRRQAEEAARRLPVTLLFPLVLTALPAFVLLAVIPILAGSIGSLSP